MWWTERLAILAIIAIVIFLGVLVHDSDKAKKAFYTECLTTDYDKFQCYSMIYGDK